MLRGPRLLEQGISPYDLAATSQEAHPHMVGAREKRQRARFPSEMSAMSAPDHLERLWAYKVSHPVVYRAKVWPDVEYQYPAMLAELFSGSSGDNSEGTWRTKEQIDLETRAVQREADRYAEQRAELIRLGRGANVTSGKVLLRWYEPLVEELRTQGNLWSISPGEACLPNSIETIATQLSAEKNAVLTLHIVLGRVLSDGGSSPFVQVAADLGRAVQNEINYERLLKTESGHRLRRERSPSPFDISLRARLSLAQGEWTRSTQVQVGSLLIKVLLDSTFVLEECAEDDEHALPPIAKRAPLTDHEIARMLLFGEKPKGYDDYDNDEEEEEEEEEKMEIEDEEYEEGTKEHLQTWLYQSEERSAGKEVPAFQHKIVRERKGGSKKARKQGYLVAHPNVMRLLDVDEVRRAIVHAHYLPMLVPPKPWMGVRNGGYLTVRNYVMRTSGSTAQLEALRGADLGRVYEALDVLGETPWRVHERLFAVMEEAWRRGGGVADMPARVNDALPPPPPPDENDENAHREWARLVRRIERRNRNKHSLRCDTLLKMQVAKEFLGRTVFFPHNLDFRGRTYPIPPHLNHMGQDLCRGLMVFDVGKPLGPRGLRWLKVQLANLYGKDKITYDARVEWIDSQLPATFEACERPLDGGDWWLGADNPWQALACGMEIRDAIRSGDPESFVSNLPVHQDGSCNGLQHYAALGGDEFGAQQVNLIPADSPQDVYSGVARLVAERVRRDAAHGNEMAAMLEGRIERKVVKQTIMTSVYGVTAVGARVQIENAMSDRPWARDLDDQVLFNLSMYLTRHTFDALQEMFVGARQTMRWLGDCAQAVGRAGHAMEWATPLGLPVVQPYRRRTGRSTAVKTVLQTVMLAASSDDLPVAVQKQRTAFPPNYVHSLDSTHMMLTALACRDRDMTFAAVHDSFWTLAADSDNLYGILREQFVDLHSRPLLAQLREQVLIKHPSIELPPIPPRGNLQINCVLNSPYFFQ